MSSVCELTMTVFTKGVTVAVVPAISSSPEGEDCRVRSTVWGLMKTLAVPVSPPLSVAVSWISR